MRVASGAQVLLTSVERIRALPERHRIRTARLRASGYFAQCKRAMFARCPCCFDLEEALKQFNRTVVAKVVRTLGCYSTLCECTPLQQLVRGLQRLYRRVCTFRWLCDWCPPFILRLRHGMTAEEEEGDLERTQKEQQPREPEDEQAA